MAVQGTSDVPEEHAGPVRSIILCTLYISVSAGLIHFNKHLMHRERFPYALPLTAFHMITTFSLCGILYLVKPSFFPGMEKTAGRRLQLLRWFMPLGMLFAIALYCSNRAYIYCNVAFLQFMKECNVALVFALSCLVGLNTCTRTRVFILMWVMIGASIAVVGEVHFVWFGFFIQAISQIGECGKNVLGEWIMRGSELKLDSLTYTMFMAPPCLLVLIVGVACTWHGEIWTRMEVWWPWLIPNAVLAWVLNISVSLVIKECSAVTFVLAGLVKDMAIVAASVLVFGEVVLLQQLIGFGICLGGIFIWSQLRTNPDSMFVQSLLGMFGELPKGERTPILPAGKAEKA